jgi:DNA-binding XRE family transcriptional regulator
MLPLYMAQFRTRLWAWREYTDRKQSEVADLLGIHRTTYIALERGSLACPPATRERLTELFGQPGEDLLRPIIMSPLPRLKSAQAKAVADPPTAPEPHT